MLLTDSPGGPRGPISPGRPGWPSKPWNIQVEYYSMSQDMDLRWRFYKKKYVLFNFNQRPEKLGRPTSVKVRAATFVVYIVYLLLEWLFLMRSYSVSLRACAKITSQNWRPDLGQICSIRNCKATGIAGLFRGLCDWGSDEDGLKMGCENVKLFLSEP